MPSIDIPSYANLKLWLDTGRGVTSDSLRRVSAWASRAPGGISLTQSTDANKPILSRADNKGNLMWNSRNLTGTGWATAQIAPTSPDPAYTNYDGTQTVSKLVAQAGLSSHYIRQSTTLTHGHLGYANVNYVADIWVKYVNHSYVWWGDAGDPAWHGTRFNLQTGTVDSNNDVVNSSISSVGNGWHRCRVTFTKDTTSSVLMYIGMVGSGGTDGDDTFAAVGDETVLVGGVSVREATWDETEVITTGAAQFAGINGYPALVFDGTDDYLTSTAVLSNIITNSACTVFTVWQTNITTNSGLIIGDSAGFQHHRRSGSIYQISNDDGTGDTASTAISVSTVYVAQTRHESGNIYVKVNNGTETSAVSGNTATLTNVLRVGGGSASLYHGGKIAEILVFNAALTADDSTYIWNQLSDKYLVQKTPKYLARTSQRKTLDVTAVYENFSYVPNGAILFRLLNIPENATILNVICGTTDLDLDGGSSATLDVWSIDSSGNRIKQFISGSTIPRAGGVSYIGQLGFVVPRVLTSIEGFEVSLSNLSQPQAGNIKLAVIYTIQS